MDNTCSSKCGICRTCYFTVYILFIIDEKGPNAEPNIVSIRREIKIEDRNDNAPKFSDTSYTFSVNETASVNSPAFNKIIVSDADSGSNAEVKLTCMKQVEFH